MTCDQVSRPSVRVAALIAACLGGMGTGCDGFPVKSGSDEPVELQCLVSNCVPMVVPPKIVRAAQFRSIAVVEAAPNARVLADDFESRLSKVLIDDKPFYKVTRGPSRGSDAVVSVALNGATVQDGALPYTNCSQRVATVSATIRMTSTRDNEVVGTETVSESANSVSCPDKKGQRPGFADKQSLLSQALGQAAMSMRNALAVRVVKRPLKLLELDGEVKAEDGRRRFLEALAFAKENRMDRACPVFDELRDSERASPAVFYNSGFCAQAAGDWVKAYTLYKQADGLTRAPVKEIGVALSETKSIATSK